jgi:hypothetical protein
VKRVDEKASSFSDMDITLYSEKEGAFCMEWDDRK